MKEWLDGPGLPPGALFILCVALAIAAFAITYLLAGG